MSYTITSETSECIVCGRCCSGCPTGAISFDNGVLLIDSATCNHCRGYYGTPQCAAACPSNTACLPSASESCSTLDSAQPETDYWKNWFNRYQVDNDRKNGFDVYSEKLVFLLSQDTARI